MPTKYLATIALALSLGGCAPESYDLHGDERFSEEERAAIEKGVAWLDAQVGRPATRISWNYRVTSAEAIERTIRREPIPGFPAGTTGGLCSSLDGSGAVYLWPKADELVDLPGLAAHELAHCTLGFLDGYHASDAHSDGIMRVLTPMLWSEAEREQCRASERCSSFGGGK